MATTSQTALDNLARTDPTAFLTKFFEHEDYCGTNIRNYDDVDEYTNDVNSDGYCLTEVLSEGGGEGEGSSVERVLKVTRGDNILAHYRMTGYYESYNGTEWDGDWTLVVPREVLVTQYFDVPEDEVLQLKSKFPIEAETPAEQAAQAQAQAQAVQVPAEPAEKTAGGAIGNWT